MVIAKIAWCVHDDIKSILSLDAPVGRLVVAENLLESGFQLLVVNKTVVEAAVSLARSRASPREAIAIRSKGVGGRVDAVACSGHPRSNVTKKW